jgi:hypothetical protein
MKRILYSLLAVAMVATGCSKNAADVSPGPTSSSGGTGRGLPGNGQAGIITAGEWNDLDNWSFWLNLGQKTDFRGMPSYWNFYNNNRISVLVTNDTGALVVNAQVALKRNGTEIYKAVTDNRGKAELWIGLTQQTTADTAGLTIEIDNGLVTYTGVRLYADGINRITAPQKSYINRAEIALVVDATGSMGDEMTYLKTELINVISRVKSANPNATVATSALFYRDEGDEYLTRSSGFTENVNVTMDFINRQAAGGGGDFPEAVHTALDEAVTKLQWSNTSRSRIVFLLLDAPPHHEQDVIASLQMSVTAAAAAGIRIIPITASGINKETEFLMRSFAITTNGTYVFITDDSGVGNDHLEASVGNYQVEKLNDLMVRLINKTMQ